MFSTTFVAAAVMGALVLAAPRLVGEAIFQAIEALFVLVVFLLSPAIIVVLLGLLAYRAIRNSRTKKGNIHG